jgi:hypothetical protein
VLSVCFMLRDCAERTRLAQQEIAGFFRAPSGAEAFVRIRGPLVSLRKQNVALLAALEMAFTDQLLYSASD